MLLAISEQIVRAEELFVVLMGSEDWLMEVALMAHAPTPVGMEAPRILGA